MAMMMVEDEDTAAAEVELSGGRVMGGADGSAAMELAGERARGVGVTVTPPSVSSALVVEPVIEVARLGASDAPAVVVPACGAVAGFVGGPWVVPADAGAVEIAVCVRLLASLDEDCVDFDSTVLT